MAIVESKSLVVWYAGEKIAKHLHLLVVVPWEKTEWNIQVDDARHFSEFSSAKQQRKLRSSIL